jgi:hypothetical protein
MISFLVSWHPILVCSDGEKFFYPAGEFRETILKGRISTVVLLVLTSSEQLLLMLKKDIPRPPFYNKSD